MNERKFFTDEEKQALKREAGNMVKGFLSDLLGVTPNDHPDVVEVRNSPEHSDVVDVESDTLPRVGYSGAPMPETPSVEPVETGKPVEFDSIPLSGIAQTQLVDVFALIENSHCLIAGHQVSTADAEKASVYLMRALAILGSDSAAILMGFCLARFVAATTDRDDITPAQVSARSGFSQGQERAVNLYDIK